MSGTTRFPPFISACHSANQGTHSRHRRGRLFHPQCRGRHPEGSHLIPRAGAFHKKNNVRGRRAEEFVVFQCITVAIIQRVYTQDHLRARSLMLVSGWVYPTRATMTRKKYWWRQRGTQHGSGCTRPMKLSLRHNFDWLSRLGFTYVCCTYIVLVQPDEELSFLGGRGREVGQGVMAEPVVRKAGTENIMRQLKTCSAAYGFMCLRCLESGLMPSSTQI